MYYPSRRAAKCRAGKNRTNREILLTPSGSSVNENGPTAPLRMSGSRPSLIHRSARREARTRVSKERKWIVAECAATLRASRSASSRPSFVSFSKGVRRSSAPCEGRRFNLSRDDCKGACSPSRAFRNRSANASCMALLPQRMPIRRNSVPAFP
jgi:hypothetical protein